MAVSPSQDDRQRRLRQIASDWNIGSLPDPAALASALQPAVSSFRTPNDDHVAEELLKRQRQNNAQGQNSQGGIKRAFTTKKKGWEPKEIFDALDYHVTNGGSPGVAEALIAKLVTVGGDVNVAASKSKTNLLTRRKSMETFERGRILQKAIGHHNPDMVAVLVPHADPLSLNSSLPAAIRTGNVSIAELLLRHGANAAQTQDGQDAFRQICIMGGQADLVGLILASNGRPSPSWVSQAMIDAAKKGCAETVLRLSRSTADGNYNNAAALKEAVAKSRVDIALAILTGNKPPTGQGLNQAFQNLFSHPTVMPNEKMALADILLCAGAEGDVVAEALVQSSQTGFSEMVSLLISHGASLEYKDAGVLRDAISQGKISLAQQLLAPASTLSPIYASECLERIPKQISNEDRHTLLELLLRKGAGGQALDDALVEAAECGDLASVRLLLTPHFPGRPVEGHDPRRGSRGMVYDRHNTASVDYQNGLALQIAIMTANRPMVEVMLASKPSAEILGGVFPYINNLPPADRYQMAECLLATGIMGPCVHDALQRAIEEHPPRRDERFISLLLSYNADPNFNGGASVVTAVSRQDIPLLEALLRSRPAPHTAAAAIPMAMAVPGPEIRAHMMFLLLNAGAGHEGKEVAKALVAVLNAAPVDMQLLDMLLRQGMADVNFDSGAPVVLAVRNPDPKLLDFVLQAGKATPETLSFALQALSELPSTPSKASKLETLLGRTKQKDVLDSLLATEVETVLKTKPQDRVLSVLKSLLAAGADINAHKAAALCRAVAGANSQIADMLFAAKPTPASLAAALPHALSIADPMDRLTFTQRLLETGAPSLEVNRALLHAIRTFPDDLPLINLLVSRAETSDGEALYLAVKNERSKIVECLLRQQHGVPVLNGALKLAMEGTDKENRQRTCALLLKAGASGVVVSDALLAAASSGDLALGKALLENGASVEHQDGQAIVEASRAGAADVLGMLLESPTAIKDATLERGFQAATEVSDLKKRVEVFRRLLERGVRGEILDTQLVDAARFGDDGIDLVKLLLEFGASTDYNSGEAVWNSTRSAFLSGLELMLGLVDLGKDQKKPSQATMLRALKASWRLDSGPRQQVIEWLFKAGLAISEEVHIALNKAVNDAEPNLELIRLLLSNGASPLTNGCQTLVDATQKRVLAALEIFFESEVPQADMNWAFSQTYTPENVDNWLLEEGYQIAKLLLEKGAQGEGPSTALVVAIDDCRTERDAIARRFIDLLVEHKVDVNFRRGLPMIAAARLGDVGIIGQLLPLKPNSEAMSMALPYIFETDLSEDQALELIKLFTESGDEEDKIDVMFKHPHSEPVVFRALAQYPRSTKILQALLDAGYYHDQMTMARVMPEVEEDEQVSLLFWALLQPQKRVSSAVIEMLIKKGAKIDFDTRISKTTPLMLAIQSKRQDLVKTLILAGAEVDVIDVTGNTPLTMATRIGGDLGTSMMANILAAEPSKNDGSLQNAARELNLRAMRVLVEYGHDPDFPSPLHGGRSALGEICLHASDGGELTAAKEKDMEKAMAYLVEHGTDLSLQSDGKSVLLLALEAFDPVATTRALLKVGMWKHINKAFNHFSDGAKTYSATMYVARVLPATDDSAAVLTLLKANRAADTYYANDGPQPDDAVGLPDELLRAERERKLRLSRLATEDEDHARSLARANELAALQARILAERSEVDEARQLRARDTQLEGMRARAAVEEELFADAARRARSERQAQLEHNQTLAEAELARSRVVADTQLELEAKRAAKMLEWEQKAGRERVDHAKSMSAIRVREREDMDRLDRDGDGRFRARVAEQKRLVDSQTALAARLTSSGMDSRRQIGYITGELND